MRDSFSLCHPVVNALFFVLVIGEVMVLHHPAFLLVSVGAAAVCLRTGGGNGTMCLRYALPAAALAAVVNPLFSHAGATVLTYLPSGNPLTLESLAYGLGAGGMLLGVMLWFACCTRVMTADKFVYLFGRAAPALSLVLSMTLGFLPRFTRQMELTARSRRGLMGQEGEDLMSRLRRGAAVLSAVITWSLENAAQTADAMRARGYGLPGRTAFSIYRMDRRDKLLLLWMGSCAAVLLAGAAAGQSAWRWYPTMKGTKPGPVFAGLLVVYLALCLTPAILNWREEIQWRRSGSGI